MSDECPIIDAGPALNFFASHQERLLYRVLGSLSCPETVVAEIERKAARDRRFAPAQAVLRKQPDRLWRKLYDSAEDSELVACVERITKMPFSERMKQRKDRGELMVIAHAVVLAESGAEVFVIVDDGDGRRFAAREQERLNRMRRSDATVGKIFVIGTVDIVGRAVKQGFIETKSDLQKVYAKLKELDDGLVPIRDTGLLEPKFWPVA